MKISVTKTRKELMKEYPNSIIRKVTGGYVIFDSWSEYDCWKRQNRSYKMPYANQRRNKNGILCKFNTKSR